MKKKGPYISIFFIILFFVIPNVTSQNEDCNVDLYKIKGFVGNLEDFYFKCPSIKINILSSIKFYYSEFTEQEKDSINEDLFNIFMKETEENKKMIARYFYVKNEKILEFYEKILLKGTTHLSERDKEEVASTILSKIYDLEYDRVINRGTYNYFLKKIIREGEIIIKKNAIIFLSFPIKNDEDDQLIDFLINLYSGESTEVKEKILNSLGQIGNERAAKFLFDIIKNKEENLRLRREASNSITTERLKDDIKKIRLELINEILRIIEKEERGEFIWPLSCIDLKNIDETTREKIITLISKRMVKGYETYADNAYLLNKLHDNDDHLDRIRTGIVKNLDTRTSYYVISIGGNDLYTSSFFTIYNLKIRNKPEFFQEIKTIDKEKNQSPFFVMMLGKFGVLEENIDHDLNFFYDNFDMILEDEISVEKSIFLLPGIKYILEKTEKSIEMQEKLIDLYEIYKGKKNLEGQAAVGYLIKTNFLSFSPPKLSEEKRNKFENILMELPEVPLSKVPEKWFEDKKIKIKMYFYPDEFWFDITRNWFSRKIGIERIQVIGESIHLTFLQNIKIRKDVFKKYSFKISKKGNKITIKNLGWEDRVELHTSEGSIEFYKDNLEFTTIIKKKSGKNKIDTEIILTLDNSDAVDVIKDPTYDIVVHRGHSYHLEKTFPSEEKVNCHNKVLFFGSCGSFGDVPRYYDNYFQCYYIADEDTGRGEDSNKFLFYMLEAIGNGERDWNVIRRFIQGKIEIQGIKYPNDPEMIYGHFKKNLAA